MFESAADDLDRGKIRSNPRQYWVSGRSDPPTGVPPGGVPVTVYSYDLILGNWYCKTGFVRSQNKCVSKAVASSIAKQGSDTPLTGSIAASTKTFTSSQSTAQQSSTYSSLQTTQPSSSYSRACAENGSCYGDISVNTGRAKTVRVGGYYRRDGTYVRGHYRSKPR